jgi:hypothetical protein
VIQVPGSWVYKTNNTLVCSSVDGCFQTFRTSTRDSNENARDWVPLFVCRLPPRRKARSARGVGIFQDFNADAVTALDGSDVPRSSPPPVTSIDLYQWRNDHCHIYTTCRLQK